MTRRLGIALARTSLHVVVVEHGVVVWSASSALAESWTPESMCDKTVSTNVTSIREALTSVLRTMPQTRFDQRLRRPRCGVLVDRSFVQVRQLEGLPSLDDRHLSHLVRENAAALFLRRDAGVVTVDVCRRDGGLWGAAFDRRMIDDMIAAADERRLKVCAIAPAGSISATGNELALAAASVSSKTPLAWTNASSDRRNIGHDRTLMAIKLSALIAGAAVALLAPTFHGMISEPGMRRELGALHGAELDGLRSTAELRRVNRSLVELAAFAARRGQITALLGEISSALPESTAISSLHVDSSDVNLTAIAPHVTTVLSTLARMSGVGPPKLVGAIARDANNGAAVERAAFRMQRVRPKAAP